METLKSTRLLLTLLLCVVASVPIYGQNVGIGEATPGSKLDIVNTNAAGNTVEINHNSNTNGSSAVWIRNNGIGRGLNVQSNNPANNIPSVQISQLGTGNVARGLDITMDANATAFGASIFQNGSSDALYLNPTGTGWGIFNVIGGTGNGIYNQIGAGGFVGTVQDLTAGGGIGTYSLFDGAAGTGFYVDSIGGNGWGVNATVRTATASTNNIVYGGVIAGTQHGQGHGMLINHYGNNGRGAEFNINNPNNDDPALFVTSTGGGDVMTVQNQSNNIVGTISVGDFAYTGTDIGDHIGLAGSSTPANNWGVGVEGTGNWIGVRGVGGFYALYAQGDLAATGAKNFIIDHPHDPENKFLRHYSIESNEVINLYRGMVTLDASGQALVDLPNYFSDINTNFSYQLTPVGTPQQPFVAQEIQGNTFKVGGAPNSKVSWVVYAERNDLYFQQNPEKREAEFDKPEGKKGKYLSPELYGQPMEMQIGFHPSKHQVATQSPPSSPDVDKVKTASSERRAKQVPVSHKVEQENQSH